MTAITRLVYSIDIASDNGITSRCLRKWIQKGRFPPPDGNLHGRNFWLRSTYERWQADVLAGKYSQPRRPGSVDKLPRWERL
jgi:hypothetical protein